MLKQASLMAFGLVAFGWVALMPTPSAQAECRASSVDPVYQAGKLVDITCDTNGNIGVGGGAGSATAAAPTFTEASAGSFSFDLAGNVRVHLGTLFSGEDQPNNLLMTSGGAVRSTVMGSAMVVGGDGTATAATSLKVGQKRIYGSVDGTGAVTQTQKIYGGLTSGVTATNGELLCTLTLSGTTHAHDGCNVTSPHLFYIVVPSGTTGTGATGVVTAMY